jgi:hypothetical protein
LRTILFLMLSAAMAQAQRNEISLQFGTTLTQRRSIAVPPVLQPFLGTDTLREDNGLAGGIVWRIRIVNIGPAALLAEVPVFFVQATNADLIPAIARPIFGNTSGISGFITPGGVVRFLPSARLSPFVFFGAGYAHVVEAQLTANRPVRGRFVNEGTWAVNYGGGVDLRLFRAINLRAELRNFYTGMTQSAIVLPEETRQRNTLLLTGGLAFRF